MEADGGTSMPLVSNGAVNLAPRWAPDGKRIVFVSSSFEGRWHVFTVEVRADGHPGAVEARVVFGQPAAR